VDAVQNEPDRRAKQIARDEYYMRLADAVETGADCLGTKVGAVIVLEDRVISTGYNGTPSGFANCKDGGCVRCKDRWHEKQGNQHLMSDEAHKAGQALDRCVCVHAEQNAFITAARFGIRVDRGVLYTTQSPCFSCLKESVQAGITRIVYHQWYKASYSPRIAQQYRDLYEHLTEGDPTRFEALGGGRPQVETDGQMDSDAATEGEEAVELEPPSEES
jgi:dCMP deaminase